MGDTLARFQDSVSTLFAIAGGSAVIMECLPMTDSGMPKLPDTFNRGGNWIVWIRAPYRSTPVENVDVEFSKICNELVWTKFGVNRGSLG
ncbi:hypothetical protein PAPYR_11976 [Paratrimastix pyriformis]|uniref:Uncharacterized protein n=1 Tax=Paratrimastix pyriformis TaxID=342808 RepID=A0ABQ8U2Q1_9EUKA|nr:hypothetical protein PAPYR_11976 [Paratrimastix pyriformis]